MIKIFKISTLFFAFLLVFAGCSNKKRLAKGKPLRPKSPSVIINKNTKSTFDFEYLGMKLGVDYLKGESNESFKANVKIKKDSVIWLSISPALGIEVFRVIITPDSVKMISKIPNDKYYYEGDFNVIRDMVNMDLNFGMIQDILVGNPIMMDKQDDKFISLTDGGKNHVLISRFDRKLKRILNYDEKKLTVNDSIELDYSSSIYQKLKRKAKPEELFVKRFWVDGYNFYLTKALYDDFYNVRQVTIDYTDFKVTNDQFYPSKGSVKVITPEGGQIIKFKTIRLKTGKKYEFPYEVPDGFERKEDI